MKKRYIYIILSILSLTSCGDFLDEYSTDARYCESVKDIEDLMIGNAFMEIENISVSLVST